MARIYSCGTVCAERFEFYTGQQVTDIDAASKKVKTNTGHEYSYDILVLATGSEALYPPYMTPERAETIEGVFVYRNVSDLNKRKRFYSPHISEKPAAGPKLHG